MMMMDLLADHGLRAASFMDNQRGASDETMTERLRIARTLAARRDVKAIVFQTVIASRSLAERIDALIAWITAEPLPKPLFVGFAAGHGATRQMSIGKLRAAGCCRLHRSGRASASRGAGGRTAPTFIVGFVSFFKPWPQIPPFYGIARAESPRPRSLFRSPHAKSYTAVRYPARQPRSPSTDRGAAAAYFRADRRRMLANPLSFQT
jgi:hypothetical protein